MKNDKFLKIVLTGGPMAGKTSIAEYSKNYFGNKILVMPEIPTFFHDNFFGDARFFSPVFKRKMNKLFFDVQKQLEKMYVEMARREKTKIVLLDRGLLDGAAYHPNGMSGFLKFHNVSKAEIYRQYDAVIWIETFARVNKENRPILRGSVKQSPTDMLKIADDNFNAWKDHPRFYKVQGGSVALKRAKVFSIIDNLLGSNNF